MRFFLRCSLIFLACCRKDEAPRAAPLAAPSVSALPPPGASSHAAPTASAPRPRPAPSGSAPTALEGPAREQAERYVRALGRGRIATGKKQFPAAIKAFDEALAAQPGDARALAERGYARLLADDLDAAEKDLHAALDHHPEKAVLSAAVFNLSLIAKKRGNDALASDLTKAAKAARSPHADGSCMLDVRRSGFMYEPDLKVVETLRQARGEMARDAANFNLTPSRPFPSSDEEAALRAAFSDGKPPPWLVEVSDPNAIGSVFHLLFERPDKKFSVALRAGQFSFSRCGSTSSVDFDLSGIPSVTVQETSGMVGYMCASKKTGDAKPCVDAPGEDWEPVQSFCATSSYTIFSTYFDPATGAPLLQLIESAESSGNGPTRQVVTTKTPDGVRVVGGGCNEVVPFKK